MQFLRDFIFPFVSLILILFGTMLIAFNLGSDGNGQTILLGFLFSFIGTLFALFNLMGIGETKQITLFNTSISLTKTI